MLTTLLKNLLKQSSLESVELSGLMAGESYGWVQPFWLEELTADIIVANYLDNLYDDDDSESGNGWISWFCDLEGHEFFVEVDEEYIRDNFNLHGLREKVQLFK